MEQKQRKMADDGANEVFFDFLPENQRVWNKKLLLHLHKFSLFGELSKRVFYFCAEFRGGAAVLVKFSGCQTSSSVLDPCGCVWR